MAHYEYKFVEVPRKGGLKAQPGDTFEVCKQVIADEAAKGWRLKQVVTTVQPFADAVASYTCYDRKEKQAKKVFHIAHPLPVVGVGVTTRSVYHSQYTFCYYKQNRILFLVKGMRFFL